MALTLAEIAELTGGRLAGDGARRVTGAAPPESAGPDDVTFVTQRSALARLGSSRAGAAVVPEDAEVPGRDVVHHRNPHLAMAIVLERLHPSEEAAPGVSPAASVDVTARLGDDVAIGPYAVVEREAVLGARVRVGAGAHVGRGVRVGDGTVLHPRAVLYRGVVVGRRCVVHSGAVVGADGFGFTRDRGRHRKIPQVGGVEVGDEVEIGANSCIDAGTLSPTRIGSGTKIDNLVQVGHNCQVGERVILCGGVAIAGSVVVEDDVTLAGQVGVAGHLTVGRGATAGARAGIVGDVPAGAVVAGMPHLPFGEWRRLQSALRHLPAMRTELRALRKRVAELEQPAD